MNTYDTIIFDLDGTLLNTLDDLADSVNYALTLNNFPSRNIESIKSFVGNGVRRLIDLALPEGESKSTIEKCFEDFRVHYESNIQNKTAPYSGTMDLLDRLYKEKYKLAIVSNKFDAAVKSLNKELFHKYIKVAIGESQEIPRKPAPDMVFKAIEQLGSANGRSIYVGDTEVDIRTAKNTGIPCVGVTWGFRDRKVLEEEGADFIIDKPEDLLSIIA